MRFKNSSTQEKHLVRGLLKSKVHEYSNTDSEERKRLDTYSKAAYKLFTRCFSWLILKSYVKDESEIRFLDDTLNTVSADIRMKFALKK